MGRRGNLVESVVDAVLAMRRVSPIAALLRNRTARISDDTLDAIAAIASGAAELHQPLVDRENLPVRIIRRIASFLSAALVEALIERQLLNDELGGELRRAVRRRIDRGDLVEDQPGYEAFLITLDHQTCWSSGFEEMTVTPPILTSTV